jgi:hypothetical protein
MVVSVYIDYYGGWVNMKVRVLATSIGLRVDGAGYLATLYWMFVARERQRDLEGREKFSTMARTWNPPTILIYRAIMIIPGQMVEILKTP